MRDIFKRFEGQCRVPYSVYSIFIGPISLYSTIIASFISFQLYRTGGPDSGGELYGIGGPDSGGRLYKIESPDSGRKR